MEKSKRGLIVAVFLGIFLISFSSAFTINPEIPTSIPLKCDQSYNTEFIINPGGSENITVTPGIISDDNMNLALTHHPTTNHLYISLFQNGECVINNKVFSFSINEIDYSIIVNITEDLWALSNITLKEGEMITIGGIAEFSLLTAGEGNILFMLEGCDYDSEDFLNVGETHEAICDGEVVRFEVLDSYKDLDASRIQVYSSEAGWNIVKGESTEASEDDCELGLDTLGAKVKRGNIFAITTLNILNNKKVKDVSVTILDQTGELSAINGLSSNTGFFSERLHEDYKEDLIVQLEKEGCEPNTQVILFENSYNDYITEKENEQNSRTLNFTIREGYKTGEEISFKVVNLLNEEIADAEVKITTPSDISSTIKTEFDGSFNFTLDEAGIWKIQIGKEGFSSSELINFEVISSEFVIVSLVNGEVKSEFKKGDKIILEMRDEEDLIIIRTFTALLGDEEIEFVDGESEEIIFKEEVRLEIPSGGGYEEYNLTLRKKESNINIWYILLGVVGLVVIVFIVVAFSKKKGTPKKSDKKIGEIGFPQI